MSGEKTLRVPAKDEQMSAVMSFVDAILEENDCAAKAQMQIDVAVEELFVNIAHYAYPDTEDGWAELRAGVENGVFTITLVDGGIPYDPLKKEDPDITLSADERQIGGLGIYMVKKSMDALTYEYRDGCNVLTVKKSIAPPPKA